MENSNNNMQLYRIPILYIQYSINEEIVTYEIQANNYSWKYTNPDGTSSEIIAESFLHPLDNIKYLSEIIIPFHQPNITLFFSSTPLSYTVTYWPDYYAGTNEAYYNQYLNAIDNVLTLPKDEMGYVFQVNAIWPQGNADYAFHAIYF